MLYAQGCGYCRDSRIISSGTANRWWKLTTLHSEQTAQIIRGIPDMNATETPKACHIEVIFTTTGSTMCICRTHGAAWYTSRPIDKIPAECPKAKEGQR